MKRKVIQIANSTQLVSLPRKWALEHNILKGDELEVKAEGNTLIISQENKSTPLAKISIDITHIGSRSKRLIGALYQAGYDEIHIKFNNLQELNYVQEIMKTGCIGFEIIEQGKNYVLIKNVSNAIPEEFEMIFKRCMHFLVNLAQESLQAAQEQNIDDLNQVLTREFTINKLVDFCIRLLYKDRKRESIPLYKILTSIEEIADEYKYLYKYRIENKSIMHDSLFKIIHELNTLLEKLYAVMFSFDINKLKQLYIHHDKTVESIKRSYKNAQINELQIIHHIRNISRLIHEMDHAIISWNVDKIKN